MNIRFFERDGKWWLDIRSPGLRKRVPSGTSNRQEAERLAPGLVAKALEAQAVSNVPEATTVARRASGPTLREAFKRGMKERESWIQSKDKTTLEHTFEALGLPDDMPVAMLTRDFVRNLRAKWQDEPGIRKGTKLSPSSINHRLSMLSVLLKVCDMQPHGVPHFSVKGNRRTRRILQAEIQAGQSWLLANAKRKGALSMCDLLTVALETGAREGELIDVQDDDIRGDTVTLRNTKNGDTRIVTLPPASQKIFENRRGLPGGPFGDLSVSQLQTLWNEMKNALGLKDDPEFVFHALRHEAASRLAEAGVNPFTMKEILGHSSINTTQIYVKTSQQAMREAQALVQARQVNQEGI